MSLWNRLVVTGGSSSQSSSRSSSTKKIQTITHKSIVWVCVCVCMREWVYSIYFRLDERKNWRSPMAFADDVYARTVALCSLVFLLLLHPLRCSPCAVWAHTMRFIWWLRNSIRLILLFYIFFCVSVARNENRRTHAFVVDRSLVSTMATKNEIYMLQRKWMEAKTLQWSKTNK